MWFQKKRYISPREVDVWCRTLTEKIKQFEPDIIVSVEQGGWYVGQAVSNSLSVPHLQITIGRPINYKKLYGAFPRRLRFVPSILHGVLFLLLRPALIEGLGENETCIAGKKILIVDDAAQSGLTLKVASIYIEGLSPSTILTAVLSDVCGKNIADFKCLEGVRFYPWSKSSPEYTEFLTLKERSARTSTGIA